MTTDPRPLVLFVNSAEPRCGVHQYGERTIRTLAGSKKYNFVPVRVANAKDWNDFIMDVERTYSGLDPVDFAAIIINYHPATIPWLHDELVDPLLGAGVKVLTLIHEEKYPGRCTGQIYTDPDHSSTLRNRWAAGRPLAPYQDRWAARMHHIPPVIGSFGLGVLGKGYLRLARVAKEEFPDGAVLRLLLPATPYADPGGGVIREWVGLIEQELAGSLVKLVISHDFLSEPELLEWLATNDLNAFLYEDMPGRGVASVLDLALAVDRPVVVTDTSMFRHVTDLPLVFGRDGGLKGTMQRGTASVLEARRRWGPEVLCRDYELVLDSVLGRSNL